ncbi:nuclease domain-containing protein [Tritrichomonas musculus]|uniref:Nuclease domain-containing protein n=1 Tax=Tritrichomonas musculus TaxID=1915356 RepID=A0ABR2KTI9_9EUKA
MSRGIVYAILSGDTLAVKVIDSRENTMQAICIDYIQAPHLGTYDGRQKDEPNGWNAFEFVKKLALSKRVILKNIRTTQNKKSNPIYGPIPLSYARVELFDNNNQDLGRAIVEAGYANVRIRQLAGSAKENNQIDPEIEEYKNILTETLEAAKEAKIGIWSEQPGFVRSLPVEYDPNKLIKQKTFDAIIDTVISGSSFGVFLLPNFENIRLQLAGVRTPGARRDSPEPFGLEAKQFCETRILQRNVKVEVFAYNETNGFFSGRVLHPNGDISIFLLNEGLAQMNNQTASMIPNSGELRQAESRAKEAKKNLWKNFDVKKLATVRCDGRVTSIKGSSSVEVDAGTGGIQLLFLSGCRVPKFNPSTASEPFGLEARETLRKMLVGRQVQCMIDYNVDDRKYATIYVGNTCVNESLAAAGLCNVFVAKNQNPSERIDSMMAAEKDAKAKKLGIHSLAPGQAQQQVNVQLNDLSNKHTRQKSVPFLHYINNKVNKAVIEYFVSATRFVALIPSAKCIIRVNLQGIDPCDSSERLGYEALEYCNANFLQRDIELQVFDVDKVGLFIGNARVVNANTPKNTSTSIEGELLSHGFTKLNSRFSSKCPYSRELEEAQKTAQEQRIGVWSDSSIGNKLIEPGNAYKVTIVNVYDPVTVCIQVQSQVLNSINDGFKVATQPVGKVMKGDLVAAIFENKIYRAKVNQVNDNKHTVQLDFIDMGIEDEIPIKDLRALPPQLVKIPPQAAMVALAGLKAFKIDDQFNNNVIDFIYSNCEAATLYAHLVYEYDLPFVLLTDSQEITSGSLNTQLLANGYARTYSDEVDPPFDKIFDDFYETENAARAERKGAWSFGNVGDDDEDEDDAGY